MLHASTLKPTLEERERFSWPDRNLDMNLWRRPSPKGFAPVPPITIHAAGEKLKEEQREAQNKDQEIWTSKLVVDDTDMHFHRLTSGTELLDKGFYSSNQLDRLKGLLKDEAQTLALQQANFQEIPALGVVQNPSVDGVAREEGTLLDYLEDPDIKERHNGFVPGAYDNRSLLVDKNRIPIKSMEHHEFIQSKGHDFRLYHKERSAFHKPHLKPLNEIEKNSNLFRRIPTPPEDTKLKKGPGNVCFRQPPPGIKPAPIQTEFYYPDREMYWESPCSREVTNKKVVINH